MTTTAVRVRPGLLANKLYAPPPRPTLVPRPHLSARLDKALALAHKLILVSAPAGFGKTTIVTEWIFDSGFLISDLPASAESSNHPSESRTQKFGWLSLDAADNDLNRFLMYLLSAFERLAETSEPWDDLFQLGRAAPQQAVPVEGLLTMLLNRLPSDGAPRVLVLDDYHVIEQKAVHDALAFLLDHLPPYYPLVLTTRADPLLPLSRLRARAQVTELRADDLRFTSEQAAAFLNETMGLELTPEQIAALEERTEGWIAGLQLAALAMEAPTGGGTHTGGQVRRDAEKFITAFAGNHRYIVDYLVEEVLRNQAAPVQEFLLQTSILERLSGALCDAVTGRDDSLDVLETLERSNLFLMPLDGEREWYRYHHLFADVLRMQAARSAVGQELAHRRAADWFAAHGFSQEAIQHALASGDPERAAALIQENVEPVLKRGEFTTLARWLDALPPAVLHAHPALALANAQIAVAKHQIDTAAQWVETAEEAIAKLDAPDAHARWQGETLVLRAAMAHFRNDSPAALVYAREALELLPETQIRLRLQALFYLGMTYGLVSDMERAEETMREVSRLSRQVGDIQYAVYAEFQCGAIQSSNGEMHRAAATYTAAVELAKRHHAAQIPTVGWLYCDLGMLEFQWNNLAGADRYWNDALELARIGGTPRLMAVVLGYRARLGLAMGDRAGAVQMLADAYQIVETHHLPERYRIIVEENQVMIALAVGQPEVGIKWAERYLAANPTVLTDETPPNYLQEFERTSLARVLLAQNKPQLALPLLAQVQASAERAGRMADALSVMPLRAIGYAMAGEPEAARELLIAALDRAAPEQTLRSFLDEAERLAPLLHELRRTLPKRNLNDAERARLAQLDLVLAAMAAPAALPVSASPATQAAQPLHLYAAAETAPLYEPLTVREQEILRYMAAGWSNTEIAQQLVVETGTVKKHINHLFSKLDVQSRTQAVARARALGIVT